MGSEMSNSHINHAFRGLIDAIAGNHRTAREELRGGMAALDRVNRQTMSEPTEPMKIIIEKSPYPNAALQLGNAGHHLGDGGGDVGRHGGEATVPRSTPSAQTSRGW